MSLPPTEDETAQFQLIAVPALNTTLSAPVLGILTVDHVAQTILYASTNRHKALPVHAGITVTSPTEVTVTLGLDNPAGTTVGQLVGCGDTLSDRQAILRLQNLVNHVFLIEAQVAIDAQAAADACAALEATT